MTLRNAQEQERLIECVRAALALLDAGEPVDPIAICREHPHLAGPLAEVLGLTGDLPLLQQQALREDPLAGVLLAGRYRLATCLGRGAMGIVYRGEDQELRRAVAVKILDVRLFRDPEAERRFQREAEALALLQHANVVAVYDRGRTPEGIHFLVMELLDGVTLQALLERIDEGRQPIDVTTELLGAPPAESHWPRLCARWALDLARGLASAHERSLVHRDVKPSNVFLARPGRPVLLDFGIVARASDQRLTATQTTIGTPWYMAPEQLRAGGLGVAMPTLDVYGLGATLYHLLGGRPPYEGDVAAVLAALSTREPVSLAVVRPGLPRDLLAIVEKCLERDVDRRYPTAHALAEDLEAFLLHQPVKARPLGPFGRRLRAWRRAPARPIAVAALALTMLVSVIAVPIWLDQRAAKMRAAKADLYATLPSLLAVEGWPDERILNELDPENQEGIRLLDEILALDPGDMPARLYRAFLRLDLGEHASAAADLEVLARSGNSTYLHELAKRYATADRKQRGTLAIDVSNLPEPSAPEECYIAGCLELRNRHVKGFAARADALFERAGDYLPARDQRLLTYAALAERAGEEEKRVLSRKLYDETIALQVEYHRATARTCAMRGTSLLLMARYREAVDELLHSLELRPNRHSPHQNLGVAYLRLGDKDASEHHLREALRIRPLCNTRFMLAQLARDRGDFATAYQEAAQLPKSDPRLEAWMVPDLVGTIALNEATSLLTSDRQDLVRARQAAARAVASYEEALALHDSPGGHRRRAMAAALQEEDPHAGLLPFAKALLEDADNAHHLATLAYLLGTGGLDAEETAWVAAILRRLGAQRAAGHEALRKRLEAEIEVGLRPYR